MEQDYINFIDGSFDDYDTTTWCGDGLNIIDSLSTISSVVSHGEIGVFRNKTIDPFGNKIQSVDDFKKEMGMTDEDYNSVLADVSFLESFDSLMGSDIKISPIEIKRESGVVEDDDIFSDGGDSESLDDDIFDNDNTDIDDNIFDDEDDSDINDDTDEDDNIFDDEDDSDINDDTK